MKQTRLLMGMPITIEVVDPGVTERALDTVYAYFEYIDAKFSTYKERSEISLINNGQLALEESSQEMRAMFTLAEQTREETAGYFDIARNGSYDPSGIVKGWAVYRAAQMLWQRGFGNYYVEAGGDIEAVGENSAGEKWRVGIRNPFNINEIVKVLAVSNCGIATSGTSVRGQHIYNPRSSDKPIEDIVSLTVIGPNIYEADRFATAGFAMGPGGILFIEELEGFDGYMIDNRGRATYTSGFVRYVSND